MAAGQTRRFVLEAQNLQGKSAWLDDFVVYLKDGQANLEPVSKAKGAPSVVTYADGICYINGKPTFMLGFLRSDPDVLKGTPFNFCAPPELVQPDIQLMDKCAEYGLWTSVNLTATLRAVAPDNAVYFAEKYKNPSYPLALEDQLKKVPSIIIWEEFNYLILIQLMVGLEFWTSKFG